MLKVNLSIWIIILSLSLGDIKFAFSEGTKPQEETTAYIEVDHENYESEVIEFDGPAIVFFYAQWCPYSGSFLPIYEEIEKKYSPQVKFCRFRLGEEYKDFESQEGRRHWRLLKENYGVDIIPTLIMFNAGKELDRMRGRPEKETVGAYRMFLKKWIDTNLIDPQENPYRFAGTLLLRRR
jgi:thioredoxin 1